MDTFEVSHYFLYCLHETDACLLPIACRLLADRFS